MDPQTFVDAHMHAFNLSHPSLMAFVRRVVADLKETLRAKRARTRVMVYVFGGPGLLLAGTAMMLGWTFPVFRPALGAAWKKARKVCEPLIKTGLNLLAVFENDIASCFLLMEDCLRRDGAPLLDGDSLRVGDSDYARYILTPLMMDFGYKSANAPGSAGERRFRYDKLAGKPIVETPQDAVDCFEGTAIDVLLLGDWVLSKRPLNEFTDTTR